MKKESDIADIKIEHYWRGTLIETEQYGSLVEWECEIRRRARQQAWKEAAWAVMVSVVFGLVLGLCGIIFFK